MSDRPSPCPWKRSRDTCIGHRPARRSRPDAGDPLRTPARCPPGRTGGGRLGRHHAPHGGRTRCHRRGPVACSGRSRLRGTGVPDHGRAAHVPSARAKPLVDAGVGGGGPAGDRASGEPTAPAATVRHRPPSRRRRSRSPDGAGAVRHAGRPSRRPRPVLHRDSGEEGWDVASTAGRAAGRVPGRLRDYAFGRRADRRQSAEPPTRVCRTRRTRRGGDPSGLRRPTVGGTRTAHDPAPDRSRAAPARKPPPTVGARCADWTGPSGACARPRRPARSSTPRARSPSPCPS